MLAYQVIAKYRASDMSCQYVTVTLASVVHYPRGKLNTIVIYSKYDSVFEPYGRTWNNILR